MTFRAGQIVQNVKASNLLLGRFATVGMFLNNFLSDAAEKTIPKFTPAPPSLQARTLIMECVFKQIAIHPDRENCDTESNAHELVTTLKHFNARATKKLITLRKKTRSSL